MGSEHTVTDLRVELIEWESVSYTTIDHRGTVDPSERHGLLRLRTSEGLEGHCFLGGIGQSPLIAGRQIEDRLRNVVVGMGVAERTTLWQRLPGLTGHSPSLQPGWAAIDIALWDAAGKAAGAPVCDLLGVERNRVPAYATCPPSHREATRLKEDVAELVAAGFRAYKLHPGPLSTSEVRKAAEALRSLGDDIDLMLDPGNAYSLAQALEIGAILDRLSFRWFEDPLAVGDIEETLQLASAISTPVAVSDSASFTLPLMRFFASRGFSVLRSSSRWLGITGLQEACLVMRDVNGSCEFGLGGNPSMNAANLHVMLAVRNSSYYEHWLPAERHEFGVVAPVRPERGWLLRPTGPGLGLELDEDWLDDHTVGTL